MSRSLEILVERRGGGLLLRSPEVGYFTCALPQGSWLAPGARVGILHALGRRFELVLPRGASGRVVNAPPEAVLQPVGYGSVLYELAPLEAASAVGAPEQTGAPAPPGALVFLAPNSGRFWHRPAPGDAPFVRAGDVVSAGQTIGLIEVMKTFTHLVYSAEGGLPARALVKRLAAGDGAEVSAGDVLLELEMP
jgi:biotin carboxyl carrier protein